MLILLPNPDAFDMVWTCLLWCQRMMKDTGSLCVSRTAITDYDDNRCDTDVPLPR